MNPVKWWQRRARRVEHERHFLAHRAESDVRDNQRLAESYKTFPVRLVAVVIGDVFMDTDIRDLWRSLDRHLAPDENLMRDRHSAAELLRRAESKAGGREWLGPIHFYRPGEGRKYLGGAQEIEMPAGVESLALLLNQFAPGMVMGATVVAPPADLAASVFEKHHSSPFQRTHGGISYQFVTTAKAGELEQRFRELAAIDLLPKGRGLLAHRRFPAGTMVVWSTDRFPARDDRAVVDVVRVLGFEDWQWWEGDNRRLHSGVPSTGGRSGRGGYSLLLIDPVSEADQKTYGSSENVQRYHLEDDLNDWLPLLLLNEAALVLGDEAGRLRERLSRRASSRLRRYWPLGLAGIVRSLSDLQYRLQRLRQAAKTDGGRRGFQDFPMMVFRPERLAQATLGSPPSVGVRLVRWLRESFAEPKPAARPVNLRDAALEGLDRLIREGLDEVRLSFDRARLLSDIRSTNVLLGLTAVLAVLTLILVFRTAH